MRRLPDWFKPEHRPAFITDSQGQAYVPLEGEPIVILNTASFPASGIGHFRPYVAENDDGEPCALCGCCKRWYRVEDADGFEPYGPCCRQRKETP